eukprot:10461658-Alexandrium_andersonii.AAC.1
MVICRRLLDPTSAERYVARAKCPPCRAPARAPQPRALGQARARARSGRKLKTVACPRHVPTATTCTASNAHELPPPACA